MSLPQYIAAALPITFILFLTSVWWDRRWKLQNLPTPVRLLVHVAPQLIQIRILLAGRFISRLGP